MEKYNCVQCSKETINPKFCSLSCSAKYNNTLKPKRTRRKECKLCNKPVLSQYTYCNQCHYIQRKSKSPLKPCLQCGKDTTNKKFCSSKCCGFHNTKEETYYKRNNPIKKENPSKRCRICDVLIPKNRKICTTCVNISRSNKKIYFEHTIISDISPISSLKRTSIISRMARQLFFKDNKHQKCYLCGYPKHVDVCHIKPIASFPLSSTIHDVNNNNLIGLCKNHHWELDHNLLCDDYIEKIKQYNNGTDRT